MHMLPAMLFKVVVIPGVSGQPGNPTKYAPANEYCQCTGWILLCHHPQYRVLMAWHEGKAYSIRR